MNYCGKQLKHCLLKLINTIMSTINLKLHFFKLFLIKKIINKIKWFGIKGSWVEWVLLGKTTN